MKLNLAECDLSRILGENISDMKSLFEGREIRFTPPEIPATVRADREIVSRVIQNLLGNAIKFTPDAGGIIRLGIEAAADRVRVTVKDNGPGIALKYRKKIFEKFAQLELSAVHKRYSTGLGLTFCKLAVEAHGGSIGVDGEEGKGSSFWFELPADGPAPRARPPAEN